MAFAWCPRFSAFPRRRGESFEYLVLWLKYDACIVALQSFRNSRQLMQLKPENCPPSIKCNWMSAIETRCAVKLALPPKLQPICRTSRAGSEDTKKSCIRRWCHLDSVTVPLFVFLLLYFDLTNRFHCETSRLIWCHLTTTIQFRKRRKWSEILPFSLSAT